MHVHIVLCCGAEMVQTSYQNIRVIPLFTKFISKHLGKRVRQTCMFTLFFVVV